MPKRVIIVHGWEGYPEEGWFPWLKQRLTKKGFEVLAPQFPHPDEPTIEDWVAKLCETAGETDKNTYFVGHSVGCQTILRYLETLPKKAKIGGIVLVAGFIKALELETEKERQIAKPWLETPIDFEKVKDHCKKFTAILSDNDPFVPLAENRRIFSEKLGAKIIIEHDAGHFSGSLDKCFKLPIAFRSVLDITK